MKIVLDSNILFSAMIKDSTTRRLILEYEESFYFPEYIFSEMEKHIDVLLKKSNLTETEFKTLLNLVLDKVKIVPNELTEPNVEEAFKLVKEIDPDDTIFIACVLTYPGSVLWSDDKRLKEVKGITVYTTKEMVVGLLR
jgi:predicted nucleic acid-binding protein